MKAFWTIRQAVLVGGVWKPDLPALPSIEYVVPCDVNRLTAGPAPADHLHLLAGGIGLVSEQSGGAYEHYVVYHNGSWVQRVRGTSTAHSHPGNETPDYFMIFVYCGDADYATLLAAPYNVRVLAEAAVDAEGRPGALIDVVWTTAERTTWATLALSALGISLPAEIDRGVRLVSLLLGLFQARRPKTDIGIR